MLPVNPLFRLSSKHGESTTMLTSMWFIPENKLCHSTLANWDLEFTTVVIKQRSDKTRFFSRARFDVCVYFLIWGQIKSTSHCHFMAFYLSVASIDSVMSVCISVDMQCNVNVISHSDRSAENVCSFHKMGLLRGWLLFSRVCLCSFQFRGVEQSEQEWEGKAWRDCAGWWRVLVSATSFAFFKTMVQNWNESRNIFMLIYFGWKCVALYKS